MDGSTGRRTARAAELIDELVVGHRELARAQARCAAVMMEFAETRSVCDRRVIAEREAAGAEARYKAGEFAGLEISMALKESRYAVQRTMVVARRLRADTPDAWNAWLAGDITYDKAERISRTLGRLVRDNSKALLNAVVVDVAVCKTGELLGRWLNQFVARVEPDEQDERIGRSLADRYVSVRPDLDGVSVLSAALSSLDAASIDRVLTAIAAVAAPGDSRTMQQRRADALVDVLLGRISNGCHTRWDGMDSTGFEGGGFEDNGIEDDGIEDDGIDDTVGDEAQDNGDDGDRGDGEVVAGDSDTASDQGRTPDHPETHAGSDGDNDADADGVNPETDAADSVARTSGVDLDAPDTDPQDSATAGADGDSDGADSEPDPDPVAEVGVADVDFGEDIDDWDLPASAFRPDPPHGDNRPLIGPNPNAPRNGNPDLGAPPGGNRRPGPGDDPGPGAPTGGHPCTCGGRAPVPAAGVQIRPVQVNIGIIISAASLLGFTNTPGQLADRSALIPADTIRDLAARPGTLFHRLVTDTSGNLLEVNELGRFPSKELALAVTYRDGVCNSDTCHTSAFRCDLDHVIPAPEGPTTAINLRARCRKDHRAKTHAGHHTERTGPHTTTWTTPTGHSYTTRDDPLPVEELPMDPPCAHSETDEPEE